MNKKKSLVIDTYNNRTPKKFLKKIGFLNQYLHPKSSMYLDMRTGILRSELKNSPKQILEYWSNKIFRSKKIDDYSAKLPFAKARLQYVFETINIFFKKKKSLKICDYACGEGILLDIFKKEGYSNLLGIEHSKLLAKQIRKKKIDCLSAGLGFGELNNLKRLKKINLGILSWVLCNCINPYKVLMEISDNTQKNGYICIVESSRILVPFRKNLKDYLNKKHINDTHPWHFSKTSLSSLLNLCKFEIVYINRYYDTDVLLIIAKKKQINKKLVKTDSPKKIYNFISEWNKFSKKNIFDT